MTQLFPEINIEPHQAEAIARGLFSIARADGHIHEREVALISEFFAASTDAPSNWGALERAPRMDGATLAELLPTPELRLLFLKTAFLVAYTDNALGSGESALIGEYAQAFQIPAAELQVLE